MKKVFWALSLVMIIGDLQAQTASFNFSLAPASVSGWVNIHGDPSVDTLFATSNGITISSISPQNWVALSGVGSAYDALGVNTDGFFPGGVLYNHWFQYSSLGEYNELLPQLLISGLSKDSLYSLKMTGSSLSANITNPSQYTVAGRTVYGYVQVNTHGNTASGATFNNVQPDINGVIRVYVNTLSTTQVADICGIQITRGHTNPAPTIVITSPENNDVLTEAGYITINAAASESGGSIVKVQFYVGDTTKIGESSTAPYSAAWINPDLGQYKITAVAVDANGVSNATSINVSVESLSSFWSMTGNIAMNPDSNFVGNVDSVRLAFRTKNIERMSISPTGNVGIGTINPTAQFHTTGTVRLAGLSKDSTMTRILVSDTSGNLSYRNAPSVGLTIGDGLGQTTTGSITIGDSIPGLGPHSFNSDRYQFLNGHMYSIGGSVNDPVAHPAFRVYDNGDLTAGTTMDRSVYTNAQTGFRYYAKQGMLQIGGSDRVDTTQNPIMYGHWPTSALILNSDDSNMLKGKLMNTVFAADANRMDSGTTMEGCFIGSESSHFFNSMGANRSIIGVWGAAISANMDGCAILGHIHTVNKPMLGVVVAGYANATADTANNSLIGGDNNRFGGLSQLVSGQNLINRTPCGAVLGNSNVDFTSLNYTGLQGTSVTGISGYPLFVLGNTAANDASVHSNAVTVLYNGRTQINTAGHTNNLAQADVTPKAALEVVSTNSGVLLPKLTNAQRNAIVTGDLQNGLLLYNTDSSAFQFYNGSAWTSVGSGSGGGASRWQFANGVQFDSVDNIAIGTSNPQGYKLAVNGTAIFTKVWVKAANNWPDYVFKKDYGLMDLAELERYIKAHRHLPGITSESEVKREGINLGDQQAAVLKKVEELTLYLIDENKRLKEQNKQIEQQDLRAQQQSTQLEQQNARLEQQQREIDELKKMIRKSK